MELKSLRDLYVDELKDLYSAEKQILKALPKMVKNATNPDLKAAFADHLEETEGQVQRLEQIFEEPGERPGGKKCVGMEGLTEEAKELLEEDAEEEVLDAGLISKAQHVEHYEMAGYGTVRTYARLLGFEEQAELLQETLDEEGAADKKLTLLSQTVNVEAETADSEEEEEQATSRGRGDREVARATGRESQRSRSGGTKGSSRSRGRGSETRAR
jgi:ferritin-like metal-binding protein YciE